MPADRRGPDRHDHDAARPGALPERRAFVWDGGSLTYRAHARPDRPPAGGDGGGRPRKGQTVAFLSANSAETWCAGVAASRPGPGHHLAASAGRARRSSRRHRGCRGSRADRRSQDARPARRRACRQGRRPAERRAHHGPGGFRPRRAWRRPRRSAQASAGRSHRSRRLRHHQLHRRHDGQVQGRDPPPPLDCRHVGGGRRRLRVSRRAALSGGGADHPRRRHQGAARRC